MKCRCQECVEARADRMKHHCGMSQKASGRWGCLKCDLSFEENPHRCFDLGAARAINRGETRLGWLYLIAVVVLCAAAWWFSRATTPEGAEAVFSCSYNQYERGECLPVITRECFEKGLCK